MRPKLNLKDKGQISKPNEYTDNFKSNLTCIFLSVRAKLKKTLCPRTLCIRHDMVKEKEFHYICPSVLSCARHVYCVFPQIQAILDLRNFHSLKLT